MVIKLLYMRVASPEIGASLLQVQHIAIQISTVSSSLSSSSTHFLTNQTFNILARPSVSFLNHLPPSCFLDE